LIPLPNADQSDQAQVVADGVVAYTGNDDSANAVQATEDGGVRMLTIIDNPNAPTEYNYDVTLPDGGYITINSDGGATIFNGDDTLIAAVATPWAKDANGKVIETYFTTDGSTLTQHIIHTTDGIVYPVTADPLFTYAWNGTWTFLSRAETTYAANMSGYAVGIKFRSLPGILVGAAIITAEFAMSQNNTCLAFFSSRVWWTPSWVFAFRCVQ
jgi:hypothetical protein